MSHVLGAKRYQYFEKETGTGAAWGTRPSTPVLVHAPTKSYGVALKRNSAQHRPIAGRGQSHHSQSPNSLVSGSIVMPLYGAYLSSPAVSIAQYFLDLVTDTPETLDPRPSFRAFDIHKDGSGTTVTGHEDSGLRVNKATLKGSASDGFLELTLDCIGKTQIVLQGSASALPDDRNGLLEMLFSDTVLSIGGSAVDMSEFSWEVDYGIKPLFLNGNRPNQVSAQYNKQTLSFKPLKTAATYDAYLRLQDNTELESILTIKGLHSGTAADTYTTGQFTFARSVLDEASDDIGLDDFGFQAIKMHLLKPDTSDNTCVPVWDTV